MKSNDLILRINKITGDYEVIHKGFSWVSDGRAPYIIIRKKVGKKYLSTYRPLYSAAKKEFDIAYGKIVTRLSGYIAFGKELGFTLVLTAEVTASDTVEFSLLAYDERDFESAKAYCERSFLFDNDEFNNHLYAFILYQLNDEKCIYFAEKALKAGGDSYALAESMFSLLLRLEAYDILIKNFDHLSDELKRSPRLLMYLAKTYAETGDPRAAEDILASGGGLTLLDFREGDRFLDRLYRRIRTALYGENYRDVTVPEQFDFIVSDFKTE